MTLEEIEIKADAFFEWPSEQRVQVTYTSAMLFAQHCVEVAEKDQQGEHAKICQAN